MQMKGLALLKYIPVAIPMTLAALAHAEGQTGPRHGTLPPPGPYMSSRPVITPAPSVTEEAGAAQAPMMQPYPAQSMMPPVQPMPMPMQPGYGYNPGMPQQQGYRPMMPYGNNMPDGVVPNRYDYPQPSPWQQPVYGPQQRGWHW